VIFHKGNSPGKLT